MKRVLIIAVVAASALGQIRVERADGTEESIPIIAPAASMIVEFRDAPLAVRTAKPLRADDYRPTFTRFRADLGTIVNDGRTGKSALAPEVRWEYFEVFNGVSVRVPRAAVAAIARLPYVKGVYPDLEVHALGGPATVQVGAEKVWMMLGSRGKGVTVAVLDTGIDATHEALRGKVIGGYDFVNQDGDPSDDNGHGTHVAGIIAGESSTITGVAPDARLFAYKVLAANGSGSESDVIAAIERVADPNGDGDFSDHLDIANLSLGGAGGPDDAASRAVDNATGAGVVFCIAAGNSGTFHAISSPGTARSAITVGAVDGNDLVAAFSSRGPAPKTLSMKPEVGAPGVSIVSSLPGDHYGAASGTSTATPHAAGVCALLKSLHPDWTPAQIKIALMNNAAVTTQEAMAAGAGRVDAFAAAIRTIEIDPPSIDLGLDRANQTSLSQMRSLRLTNRGSSAETVSLRASASDGAAASVTPDSLTLDPGASADVQLNFQIDNAAAAIGAKSLSGGGIITITNGPKQCRVPWTFVKAVRATVQWDTGLATLWFDSGRTAIVDSAVLARGVTETLFADAGSYDLAAFGSESDDLTNTITRASLIYLDRQRIDGDAGIALNDAQASHTIRGSPFEPSNDQRHYFAVRLVWPEGTSTLRSFAAQVPLHEIHVNDIGDQNTLLFSEAHLDYRAHTIDVLQYPALKGLSSDVQLSPARTRSAGVTFLVPVNPSPDANLSAQLFLSAPRAAAAPSLVVSHSIDGTSWSGRATLATGDDPNYSSGVSFAVAGGIFYVTPLLEIDRNSFAYGGGPRMPAITFANITTALQPTLAIDYRGPLGENRVTERFHTTISTFAADGTLVAREAGRYPTTLNLSAKKGYTIEAVNDSTLYPDLPQRATITMAIDSSRADYVPPVLTTLMLTAGDGSVVRALTPHRAGSLVFSATDPGAVLRSEATAASFRYAGETTWRPLVVTQVMEDSTRGIVFRVDLTSVANADWALVDLKLDLADAAGNSTSFVWQPAFSVGSEHPPRRRAVGSGGP